MNKQILSFLEKKTKFLVERHSLIKAIFVYGSAARKNKKPNDVDCVAIVDDTSEKFKPTVLDYIETELREITEEADKKMKIDLHFQSPRPLSVWWDSLRSGEPWVMTAVKDAYILYDPSDYIAPLKSL
ncbi:MAG: nucleotidyltransferase domain-containing protein, partial [Candidatus Aenigmarchaeota archaeon]|nr:nucleotidyltransferase domain-containing protein [Candidatus Aenigmarchaeota archaeon]